MSKPKLDKLKEYLQFRINFLRAELEKMRKGAHSEIEVVFMAKLDAYWDTLRELEKIEKEV